MTTSDESGALISAPLKSHRFTAPALAGAGLLFAFVLIEIPTLLSLQKQIAFALNILAIGAPLIAMLVTMFRNKGGLANWLSGTVLMAFLAAGIQLAHGGQGPHEWQIWGITALLALLFAALFRFGVALIIAALAGMGWTWLAHFANPPVDFLWGHLALTATGLTLARRENSVIGALAFAAGMCLWAGLSLLTAIEMDAIGHVEAGFLGALLLVVSALLLRATRTREGGHHPAMAPATLVLLLGAAIAAAFAISPFANTSHMPAMDQTAYWLWVGSCATLLILALVALVSCGIRLLHQAAILLLLVLASFAILIMPGLDLPIWWQMGAGAIMALAAIWFAIIAYGNTDSLAGHTGLVACAIILILGSTGMTPTWYRIVLFAVFSLLACGVYFLTPRKHAPAP